MCACMPRMSFIAITRPDYGPTIKSLNCSTIIHVSTKDSI